VTVLSLAAELALISLGEGDSLSGNDTMVTALAGAWIVDLLEHHRILLRVQPPERADLDTRRLAADIGLARRPWGPRETVRRRLLRHGLLEPLRSSAHDDWVVVVDAEPTGMPDVDLALSWLASGDRRSLLSWLALLGQHNASGRVLDALQSAGVVAPATNGRRNPFAPTGWQVVNRNPGHDLRARLAATLTKPDSVGARDACLLRLVETCELEYALWRSEYPERRRQIDVIRGCRVDAAVRRVVDRRIAPR
jgi:hypothetical protein